MVYYSIYFGLRVVVIYIVRLGKRGQVLLLDVHLPALQVLFRFLNNDWCGLVRRGIVIYALLGVLYRLELLPLARVLTRLEQLDESAIGDIFPGIDKPFSLELYVIVFVLLEFLIKGLLHYRHSMCIRI